MKGRMKMAVSLIVFCGLALTATSAAPQQKKGKKVDVTLDEIKKQQAMIFIDGRQSTDKSLSQLKQSDIVSVKKEDGANAGFGMRAKDGIYYITTNGFKFGVLSDSENPMHKAVVAMAESAKKPLVYINGKKECASYVKNLYTSDIERIQLVNDPAALDYLLKRNVRDAANGIVCINLKKGKELFTSQKEVTKDIRIGEEGCKDFAECEKTQQQLFLIDGEEVSLEKVLEMEKKGELTLFEHTYDSLEAAKKYGKKAAGGYFYYTKHKVRNIIQTEGYDGVLCVKLIKETDMFSLVKFSNPLIFIDGKEASNISELKMDDVVTTDYDNSPIAWLKYGDKARNGVIHIYTTANKK